MIRLEHSWERQVGVLCEFKYTVKGTKEAAESHRKSPQMCVCVCVCVCVFAKDVLWL